MILRVEEFLVGVRSRQARNLHFSIGFHKVLSLIALFLSRLVTLLPSRSIAFSLRDHSFLLVLQRFIVISSFSEKEEVAKRRFFGFAWFYKVLRDVCSFLSFSILASLSKALCSNGFIRVFATSSFSVFRNP